MKPTIDSKEEFYRRYFAGEFGNRVAAWDTVEQALAESASPVFFLRNKTPGGLFLQNVPRDEIAKHWASGEFASVTTAAPDNCRTFQGEVTVAEARYGPSPHLFAAIGKGNHIRMREDLALNGRQYCGAQAVLLMKHFMWASDYDDITEMLSSYPDAVIEFTCFDCAVGTIPGRNTVIWECRNY